jgi:hypothetical protein
MQIYPDKQSSENLWFHQRNYKQERIHLYNGLQKPTSIHVTSTNCLSF